MLINAGSPQRQAAYYSQLKCAISQSRAQEEEATATGGVCFFPLLLPGSCRARRDLEVFTRRGKQTCEKLNRRRDSKQRSQGFWDVEQLKYRPF